MHALNPIHFAQAKEKALSPTLIIRTCFQRNPKRSLKQPQHKAGPESQPHNLCSLSLSIGDHAAAPAVKNFNP